MEEALLDTNWQTGQKIERKDKQKPGTLKLKSYTLDSSHPKIKDSQKKKINNKFIFKIYLHLFTQINFIFLMIILSFRSKLINNMISTNKFVFYSFLLLLSITFIFPLFSDIILRKKIYNYIYLVVFTLSLGYILCKLLILLSSSTVKIGSILLFFELIYLIIDAYINKTNSFDLTNTSAFIGLCLLFIGSVLFFIEKIHFVKLIIIMIIIFLFGIYLIYDMNIIFLEVRRKYKENDYILATIFLYIDLMQTSLELLDKIYNTCEPEKKPVKISNNGHKSHTFIGEKNYIEKQNYKNDNNDEEIQIKRTNSAKGLMKNNNMIVKTKNDNKEYDNDEEKGEGKEFNSSINKIVSIENTEKTE